MGSRELVSSRITTAATIAADPQCKVILGNGEIMELRSAYDVMGLKYDCSHDDAKKTYRARAILLHPDRVDGGLRRDAEAAMAQLNEAWGMVRGDIERGRAG